MDLTTNTHNTIKMKKTIKSKKNKTIQDEENISETIETVKVVEPEINNVNNTKELILTEPQTKVYNELVNFIKVPDSKEIILVGYAGTGKTTLVTKLINDLVKTKICKKITIVAPTHKAVNIAKSKLFSNIGLSEELSKNINIMTIHRLLNYQSYIDTNTGEKYFAKSKIDPNWTIYDLIVVDECSMLSNQIIADISEQLDKVVNSKVKIIYVGDPAQLPPVNQTDSIIFSRDNIKKIILDKIIRTSNSQIMDLAGDHRKWIFSKKDSDIPNVFKYKCDNIKLYSIQNKETIKWLDTFIKTTNNPITGDIDNDTSGENNNIILTWTNKKCNNYNQYVRQKLFNKKNLDHFEVGEILLFNDFYRYAVESPEQTINNNNEKIEDDENEKKTFVSFYTSEQVKLIEIEKNSNY